MNATTNPYREYLEELAQSRGMSSAEELVSKAHEADPSFSVHELLEGPRHGGFALALETAAGGMSADEQEALLWAYLEYAKSL